MVELVIWGTDFHYHQCVWLAACAWIEQDRLDAWARMAVAIRDS